MKRKTVLVKKQETKKRQSSFFDWMIAIVAIIILTVPEGMPIVKMFSPIWIPVVVAVVVLIVNRMIINWIRRHYDSDSSQENNQ